MLVLSLALVLSRPATITYSCPATRFEKLLPVLSEKAGEQLTTTSRFEGKFVVVRFKDTPVEDALSRIEKALGGKFAKTSAGRSFEFDASAKVNQTLDPVLAGVHKYLTAVDDKDQWTSQDADKLVSDSLAFSEASDQAQDTWNKVQALNRQAPQQRLLRRMARAIGEKTLASVPANGRIVFSSNPNRMQRPLPAAAKAILDQYLLECKTHAEALAKKGISNENPPEMRYYMPSLVSSPTMTGTPKSATFIVKRSLEGMTVRMNVTSNDGQVLTVQPDSILIQEFAGTGTPKSSISVDGEFKPSPESALIGKAIAVSNLGGQGNLEMTPDESIKIKAFFSDLEKNEILDFAPSEVLLQTAEAMNKDLVAYVNDLSIFSYAVNQITKSNKLESFYGQGMTPWLVDEDDKGLTITPADIIPGLNPMIPRKAVSRFVPDVDKHGLSIDALADLNTATPPGGTPEFSILIGCLPFPELGSNVASMEGEAVLRMYALLDQASRSKAKQGGFSAQFRSLPPNLQTAIQDYVYNQANPQFGHPVDVNNPRVDDGDAPGVDTTDLLPNGLPGTTIVTFRLRTINSLFTLTRYGDRFSTADVASEDDAASRLAWAEKSAGSEFAQTVKLAVGDLQQLDLAIQVDQSSGFQGRYQLKPAFKASQMVDIAGLPENMRQSLKDKFEKQREIYKDMPVNGSPRKIKP